MRVMLNPKALLAGARQRGHGDCGWYVTVHGRGIPAGTCRCAARNLQQDLASFRIPCARGFSNKGEEANPLLGTQIGRVQVGGLVAA